MTALDWQDYAVGEHRVICPQCGDGKRIKNAGLKVDNDGAVIHCFKCSYIETFRHKSRTILRAPTIRPPRPPDQPQFTTLSDWGRALWKATVELYGVAVAYLEHRHCVIPPAYGALRWHPALRHPSGYVGAGLVALVSDIHTDEALSLHRTWITETGKADVHPPRMQLANHTLKNGCIKLWPGEDICDKLGIAEGIETALSMAHCVPFVWSCIDAGHLEKFPVLTGITELYISQDNDAAGIKASTACADRWHAAGRLVQVSQQQKNDLNDEVWESQYASN